MLEIFGIMIKSEALAILEDLNQKIQSMDDDELLDHLSKSSRLFRDEMESLKLLLYGDNSDEELIQEEIIRELCQEELERQILYEAMLIQNYDFDYGDVKY